MKYLKSILVLAALASYSVSFAQANLDEIISEIHADPADLESIVAMSVADNPGEAAAITAGVLAEFPDEAARIAGSAIAGLPEKTADTVGEIVRLAVAANPAAVEDVISAANAATGDVDLSGPIDEAAAAGLEDSRDVVRVAPRPAPVSPTPGIAIDASIISPSR